MSKHLSLSITLLESSIVVGPRQLVALRRVNEQRVALLSALSWTSLTSILSVDETRCFQLDSPFVWTIHFTEGGDRLRLATAAVAVITDQLQRRPADVVVQVRSGRSPFVGLDPGAESELRQLLVEASVPTLYPPEDVSFASLSRSFWRKGEMPTNERIYPPSLNLGHLIRRTSPLYASQALTGGVGKQGGKTSRVRPPHTAHLSE